MTTSPSYSFSSSSSTPILLLKTKSTPHDGYEEFFSAHGYNPAFVPVLEHHFNQTNVRTVKDLFTSGSLNAGPGRKYGGLIFTSQRAVEGFARLVTTEVDVSIARDASRSLILYTVGPATSRSLTTLRDTHLPHAVIYGSDAGDGQKLALAILEHYNTLYDGGDAGAGAHAPPAKPPLLFLVGEQRRDIIPRTLMAESLSPAKRILVDELVVYETGVMESFEGDFRAAVRAGQEYLADRDGDVDERVIWVVVFSPTGCDAMLRVLGFLSASTESSAGGAGALVDGSAGGTERRVFIATIGPTTRDHLVKNYGFEPDVCAEKPSPEGVGAGIEAFMRRRKGI
ncbi:hypothetical protein Asppvi_011210 [Aspergillus pseudoviridinutans]|uniref:Tetrapyrrole biosynthesis uroporphyrinogen III synthase domain-containing protein n=1 Tax=Aspergillus pseudoviridinutans TaxID=1517512 RepID=A0A9P3BNS0_9EURO|nr:uncharacterized protein Asppvi_011210 [Aspergillus pseudoviridinutans]GIJ92233.1 hypothetical protein Asppvi_011210 [Aspergillus pseudoviridinutans]